jgi:hypothetical protein
MLEQVDNPIEKYFFNNGKYTIISDDAINGIVHIYQNDKRVVSSHYNGVDCYQKFIRWIYSFELPEEKNNLLLKLFPKQLLDYLAIPKSDRIKLLKIFSDDTRGKIKTTIASLQILETTAASLPNSFLKNQIRFLIKGQKHQVESMQKIIKTKRFKDMSMIGEYLRPISDIFIDGELSIYKISEAWCDFFDLCGLELQPSFFRDHIKRCKQPR